MENLIHLGIIPDGNRRWSRENGMGIDQLLEKIFKMVFRFFEDPKSRSEMECFKYVKEISTYVLTKDNLIKRKDQTLEMIRSGLGIINENMDLFKEMKIQFIGELDLLPLELKTLCDSIESKSNQESTLKLTFGIAYDPLHDLERLINKDPSRPEQGKIDMIIRTGGEMRSSGFFPMHTMYSEWFYLDKFFPDLTIADINRCIQEFQKRNRRFGQ